MIRLIGNLLDEAVTGDRLAELCDVQINAPVYSTGVDRLGETDQVVFCKVDFVKDLFRHLYRFDDAGKRFFLITHNGDTTVDRNLIQLRPRCIDKWYAENLNAVHPRVFPLPLGLERPAGGGYSSDISVIWRAIARPRDQRNLVFACWNVNTSPERAVVTEVCKSLTYCTWRPHGISFEAFIDNCANHSFVVCPEGNGLDSHRLWETLYCGSIPILKRSLWAEWWAGILPVLIVSSWEELRDREFLEDMEKKIHSKEWSSYVMRMSYWKSVIADWRNITCK